MLTHRSRKVAWLSFGAAGVPTSSVLPPVFHTSAAAAAFASSVATPSGMAGIVYCPGCA